MKQDSKPILSELQPILCSQAKAWEMLAIKKTLGAALIATNQLETVRIGSRRLVKIESVRRLAGIAADQQRGLDQ